MVMSREGMERASAAQPLPPPSVYPFVNLEDMCQDRKATHSCIIYRALLSSRWYKWFIFKKVITGYKTSSQLFSGNPYEGSPCLWHPPSRVLDRGLTVLLHPTTFNPFIRPLCMRCLPEETDVGYCKQLLRMLFYRRTVSF